MSQTRWTMLISGRVQGVYYRAATEKTATELGVTGFALNLPDGRVEVVAEAEPATLEQFHQWCLQGPPAARVDKIDVTESPATGEFARFSIRR
ncbi:MAG: acylphosphatase [Marinobacter sp.]|uniref:acylphosphatase n=1 Tax=Marinobacter sp. TaxID=50741 RepID=UPI00299D8BAC|nr:acylphosphatase [Marinobacter sp.]MDX1755573.1 acylphosphatase [Marinobacter sp.]